MAWEQIAVHDEVTLHHDIVDGLSTYWVANGGPFRAVLVFRVGQADETLRPGASATSSNICADGSSYRGSTPRVVRIRFTRRSTSSSGLDGGTVISGASRTGIAMLPSLSRDSWIACERGE